MWGSGTPHRSKWQAWLCLNPCGWIRFATPERPASRFSMIWTYLGETDRICRFPFTFENVTKTGRRPLMPSWRRFSIHLER